MKKLQDLFIAHGYRCLSNYGYAEIQISEDGSMARLRYYEQEPTRWLTIQYDSYGEPFVEYKTSREYLNQFAKI